MASTIMLLLLLLLLLLLSMWWIHNLAETDVVTAHLEQVLNRSAVAVLQDDFVAFGTELEDVGLSPFGAAVAAHVLTDGLEAHGD
jgi:hypothetical protein